MSAVHYDPKNLKSDMQVLVQARENGNKYLLCLSNGQLSSSYLPYDNREAKRSNIAWAQTLISGAATSVGSYMGYDYDDKKVIAYLKAMVSHIEKKSSSSVNKDTLTKIRNSFLSLSDSYSVRPETKTPSSASSSPFKRNIDEDDGGIATQYYQLANTVGHLIPR